MLNDRVSPPYLACLLAIAFCLIQIPRATYAQVPSGTIGELQDIQTATVLAKARAGLAELTKNLDGQINLVDPNARGLPAVQLIAGNPRSLTATLILSFWRNLRGSGG